MDAGRRFAALVDALDGAPGVTPPGRSGSRAFGAGALKADGSIFAMVVDGQLVLKLPANRVVDLVASGAGGPFADGRGRPMREWVTLSGDDPASDLGVAREALEHVRSRRR